MENKKQTVHMVSLGCPKNRVDSEVMLGHLFGDGYAHVESAEGADLVIVNTCGFIDEAKGRIHRHHSRDGGTQEVRTV